MRLYDEAHLSAVLPESIKDGGESPSFSSRLTSITRGVTIGHDHYGEMTMRKLKPVTPGELLREEFLKPMGISQYRLAKEIGVPAQRISEIAAGKRSVTADTDLRLCRFFGLSKGYWLRAQAAYDTEVAEAVLSGALKKIKPWPGIKLETSRESVSATRGQGISTARDPHRPYRCRS
jgi:addiction module HigA family antidote